jgi:uncharacterized membrane protein (UPF0127 family)
MTGFYSQPAAVKSAAPPRRLYALGALALAALIGLSVIGCDDSHPPLPQSKPLQLPAHAQPRLKTMKLWIGQEELVTELAISPEQLMTGMMFRTNMAENEAMLFAMPVTRTAAFWMKNTPLPLSVAYIDPEGIIQEIHDLHPYDTNSVVSQTENIRFVLETPQGWFERHKIGTGAAVSTEKGSLMETFFPLE